MAIDLKTHKELATWNPACGEDGPHGIRFDSTSGFLFVACSARVEVLDAGHDGKVLSSVDTGDGVDDIDYSAASHMLYVGAARAAQLVVASVDASGKLTIVATVPTEKGARNPAVTAGGKVFLAHGGGVPLNDLVVAVLLPGSVFCVAPPTSGGGIRDGRRGRRPHTEAGRRSSSRVAGRNIGATPMSSDDPTTSLHTPWATSVEPPTPLERELMDQRHQADQLRLLGSAVRVAGQGIAILTPAVEALGPRIAFVNDGFCAIYGRTREEIIGQTPVASASSSRQQAIFRLAAASRLRAAPVQRGGDGAAEGRQSSSSSTCSSSRSRTPASSRIGWRSSATSPTRSIRSCAAPSGDARSA